MTALILKIVVLLAAGVIVVRAEPALNRMSRCTPFTVRVAFLLLTLGAVAEIIHILVGGVPSWSTAIVISGAAALLVCERRLRVLCPPPRRASQ